MAPLQNFTRSLAFIVPLPLRGGHYYSYIKSFKDNKWYIFNDAVVRPLEAKEGEDLLESAHGNGKV